MRKPVDFWIALILLAFCGYVAYLTTGIPTGGVGTRFGPAFFPWLLVFGIAALSLVLLLRSLYSLKTEAEGSAGETGRKGTPAKVLGKMALFLLLMLAYAASYVAIGYLVSSVVFFVVAMLMIGERRVLHVVVFPVCIVVGVYLVFTEIMQVYLP